MSLLAWFEYFYKSKQTNSTVINYPQREKKGNGSIEVFSMLVSRLSCSKYGWHLGTYLRGDSPGHEHLRGSILLFAQGARDVLHVLIAAIRFDIDGELMTVHNVVSGSLILLN